MTPPVPEMNGSRVNTAGYRLLALAVLLALTVPRMWQRGMFLDGVVVAVLARNLSIGFGSLWAPAYSETIYQQFFEWPPLGFALEAVAFVLFGDHAAVERGFAVVVLCLHAVVLAGIWRRLLPAAYDWLPILFWVLPSIVTWAAVNNMLENTQALFTSLAVYLLLGARAAGTAPGAAGWSALAGLTVVIATLVKGPVGLFPLVVPVLFFLLPAGARPRRMIAVWAPMLCVVLACAVVLTAAESSAHALREFVRMQLMPSLQGRRGADPSRASLFRHLAVGVVARVGIVAGVLWLVRRRGAARLAINPAAWFFLAVALLSSLPVGVSPRIAGHYLLSSVPFFALAAAAFALPAMASFSRDASGRASRRVPVLVAIGLVVTSVGVLVAHGTLEPRDREMIRNLDAIAHSAPRATTIGACRASQEDWGLVAYLQRFFRLSIDARDAPVNGWFLAVDRACEAPAGCQRVAEGSRLALSRCGPLTRPD